MQLAFEEQEKSSPAPAANSPRPRRPSAEPPHPQTEHQHDRGGTSCGISDELGRGPRRRSQDRGEEAREQQQREVAVELMREAGGGDGEEPGERGEKRRHPDETKIGSDTHHPRASGRSHNTGDEDDEDDEDPRPAKRRKLPPTPTDNVPTPPDEPTAVAKDHHHPSRTSRSPSVTVESALFAEFQEWPLDGCFLKHTKIGNKTIYNLEFQLPHVQEHLHSEALGMRSVKETSAEAATPHDARAHSKIYPAAVRPRIKRVRWTDEEHATILKMREEDGCSWDEIAKALPHRTPEAIQVHFSTSRASVGEADVSGGQQQKRRRGRPRKQT
jgi:hypothetical protein